MSIRSEIDGAILRLVMDKPARGNALCPSMMLELAATLRRAASESGVRVAILRGAGSKAFCTGYDLAELRMAAPDSSESTPTDWSSQFPELTEMLAAMEEFPFPLIAALNGHAIGGGALLASFCDMRVACSGVRFQIPASRLGVLYPLEGIRRLIAVVGAARATTTLLCASNIDPQAGLAWGLYESVVDAAVLDTAADELAMEVASKAPLAVAGLRSILRGLALGLPEAELRALHHEWTSRCLGSRDLAEGLSAALERRPPVFEGR